MSRFREVELARDCTAVQIPSGQPVTLHAGDVAVIMQSLADAFVVQVPTLGGLYRVDGHDADALGMSPPGAARDRAAALTEAGQPMTVDVLRDALRDVYDPEIPVNIVDLGLVYDLELSAADEAGAAVAVTMTLTAPGCGMGGFIANDVKERLERLPGVARATVELVWDPPWTPQRIAPAARKQLGLE